MAKKVEITGKPKRIKDCDDMSRFFDLLNRKSIARRLEFTNYQTMISRINNHTQLDQTVEQKAFAEEMTELMDELFYEIGLMIGRVKNDPHKRYKFLDVNDPSERATVQIETEDGERIDKSDVEYFEVPEVPDEELTNDVRKVAFTINSLSFKDDNKWRLSDGTNSYIVTISDEEFLDDVQNNRISFAKDDLLVVRLETKQYKTINGLKSDYNILEVIDHQSSIPQLDFPFK